MTVLLIVLACIAGYYWLGLRLVARPHVAREVEDYITENADHWKRMGSRVVTPREIEQRVANSRRTASGEALFLAALWPVVLASRAAMGVFMATTPLSAAEAQLQIQQRDQRIAELERELGIRR